MSSNYRLWYFYTTKLLPIWMTKRQLRLLGANILHGDGEYCNHQQRHLIKGKKDKEYHDNSNALMHVSYVFLWSYSVLC